MTLTTAQQQALKADINTNFPGAPTGSDGAFALAASYNALASPDFYVYRTSIPVSEVFDAVVWANLTPADAADGTQAWANRSLACQGKQFNLQTILIGGAGSLNGAKANIRAGLQDALTGIPSGANGASVAAGWVTLRDTVLARKATRLEKLFSAGNNGSTMALAGTMAVEGTISYQDIEAARAS